MNPSPMNPNAVDLCEWCGRLRMDHWVVNYADGPFISGQTLICPTSVFVKRAVASGRARPVARKAAKPSPRRKTKKSKG